MLGNIEREEDVSVPRGSVEKNMYEYITHEGEPCVKFITTGKHKYSVIVDQKAWDAYLRYHTWSASVDTKSGRASVKTSIENQTTFLWKFIIEHEKDEIDYWGTTIDHINNNPLDNRLSNLRIYNAMLNGTNVSSKFDDEDRRFIHEVKGGLGGYKIHYSIGGKPYYVDFFSVAKYGSKEAALKAAKEYRDKYVIADREQRIEEIKHKLRNVEFERGLRDKIKAGEFEEIIDILKKYDVVKLISTN